MSKTIRKYYIILVFLSVLFSLNSCKVFFPNLMFKTSKKIHDTSSFTDTTKKAYAINVGDLIELNVLSNKGYKLVDVGTNVNIQNITRQKKIQYLVNNNGYVKLPMIDSFYIQGYSIKEAEKLLEEKYNTYFIESFVILKVINRRVFVFIGSDIAQVVPINNENTTLIEVLASAGGISANAKAYRIKIIRGDFDQPIIIPVDLSTIEGIKQSQISIQANDIIYVDPVIKITTSLLQEITPIIGLITNVLIIIALLGQ